MEERKEQLVIEPLPRTSRLIDISGMRFARLVVVGFAGIKTPNAMWWCWCDCGVLCKVAGSRLRGGHTRSCGCLQREWAISGQRAHGKSHTRIHWVWTAMVERCTNPKNKGFKNYGGRGIGVCEEWLQFETFYADMGEAPSRQHSLERIDNDKGYSKDNCKWALRGEQNRNKRSTINITFNDKTQCLTDWAKETGITQTALYSRIIRHNWSIEEALTTPLDTTTNRVTLLTYNGETKRLSEWAKETGIDACLISYRIKRMGLSVEQALTTPVRPHSYTKR